MIESRSPSGSGRRAWKVEEGSPMNHLAIALLTGACLAVPANADFTYATLELVDVVAEYTAAGYTPGEITVDLDSIIVFHLYANFDGAGSDNGVLGIGAVSFATDSAFVDYDGTGAASEGIPSSSGGFIPLIGDLIIDSFVTINELQDPGGASSGIGGVPVPDFVNGANTYVNTDAGYGVTPVSGIGQPDVNNQVLLAQIIIENPDGYQLNANSLTGSFEISTYEETIQFPWIIPAPGALALLGVCGVTVRRPRRR
jgi:hypothetical protein